MEERYLKVFSLSRNLYIDSSPVIIEAGSLLKDNKLGNMIAQLKFRSIADKKIIATKIKVISYDIAGNLLHDVVTYQYLDLEIKRNDTFGDKTAIVLKEDTARSIQVMITEVVFEDKSVWKCDEIPEPIVMTFLDSKMSAQEVGYFKIKYGNDSYVLPERCRDLWFCKCGTVNHIDEEKCFICRYSQVYLIDKFDYSQFLKESDEYWKTEIEKKAAAELHEKELRDSKIAHRKKRIRQMTIIIGIVCFLIIAASVTISCIVPQIKYNNALSLFKEKKYDEAIEAFEKLEGYSDVESQCKIVKYAKGLSLIEQKEYTEARDIFNELGEYENSQENIKFCSYELAQQYLQSQEYQKAISELEEIRDYKDSDELYKSSLYSYAKQLMAEGDYYYAINILESISDYLDSQDLINQAKYNFVCGYYNSVNIYTYKYLKDLISISYADSQELFDKLYSLQVTIIANNNKKDATTDCDTLKTTDLFCFHVKLTNGEPDKVVNLLCKINWPNGEVQDENYQFKTGDSATLSTGYAFPYSKSATGIASFEVFDDAGNKLGEKKVNIVR